MICKKLNSKRTVIILGVGASVEFLSEYQESCLTTHRLTELLSTNLSSFIEYLKEFYKNDEIFWLKSFMLEINSSLRKFFGNNYNFEHIIYLVDIVVNLYSFKNQAVLYGKNSIIPNIYLSLIDLFQGGVDPYLGKILFNFSEVVRYFILDYFVIIIFHLLNFIKIKLI